MTAGSSFHEVSDAHSSTAATRCSTPLPCEPLPRQHLHLKLLAEESLGRNGTGREPHIRNILPLASHDPRGRDDQEQISDQSEVSGRYRNIEAQHDCNEDVDTTAVGASRVRL